MFDRYLGGGIGSFDCLNVKRGADGEGDIKDESRVSDLSNEQDGRIIC